MMTCSAERDRESEWSLMTGAAPARAWPDAYPVFVTFVTLLRLVELRR